MFVRVMEYLGRFGIDTRKIEYTPTFMRPPWKEIDEDRIDFILTGILKGSGSERFRREAAKIIKEKYERHEKIYTDIYHTEPYLQKKSTRTKHRLQHRTRGNHLSNLVNGRNTTR
jgi:hypothetical protein